MGFAAEYDATASGHGIGDMSFDLIDGRGIDERPLTHAFFKSVAYL